MNNEKNKKIITNFVLSSIGLLDSKIKAITYIYNNDEYRFNFYIIEKNEEIDDCISDIIFEFEALQQNSIKLIVNEIIVKEKQKYGLQKNEIFLFALSDAKSIFR